MAPLSGLESSRWRRCGTAWRTLVYERGESLYNFQGLRAFKDKFHPVWEPRYLAWPGGLALAARAGRHLGADRRRLPPDVLQVKPAPLMVLVALLNGAGTLVAASPSPPSEESFTFGAAGRVAIYVSSGPPASVVLFVSGDGGWNQGVVPMAERLRGLGALVVGIDIRTFVRNLESSGTRCAYPAGDLEELSRAVQLRHKLSPTCRPSWSATPRGRRSSMPPSPRLLPRLLRGRSASASAPTSGSGSPSARRLGRRPGRAQGRGLRSRGRP